MKKRLKINGALILVAFIVLLFIPRFFFRSNLADWQDDFAEVIGMVLILLGFLWRLSARGYKAEHSKQGLTLIITGPYSIQRHPMYFGIALIGIGAVLILFNFWALALFLLFFISRYIVLSFQEEKKLILQFGDDYKKYMKSTPILFPGIKTILKRELKDILPMSAWWFKKEIGSFFFVVIGILAIESWEDVRSEGLHQLASELATFILILILFFWLINYLCSKQIQEG